MSVRSILAVVTLAAAATVPGPARGATAHPAAASATPPHLVAGPAVRVPGTVAGGDRPAVVVDDAGTATAVWRQTYRESDGTRVHAMLAARRGIGGRWSEPRTIGCPPAEGCAGKHPQAGVDAAGVVTAAWSDGNTVMAVRRPVGGRWGTARVVGSVRDSWGWDLAVARNGEAVIVWDTHPRGSHRRVEAVIRPAHGSWRDPVSIGLGFYPQVAAESSGAAIAILSRGSNDLRLWAYRFLPRQGWGTPVRIAGGGLEGAAVAMGPRGRALVTMDRYDSGGVDVREMSSQGTWGPRRALSPTDFAWHGLPVIDSAGVETVAFLDGHRVYPDDLKVSRRAPGQPWSRTTLIRKSGTLPVQLVVNRHNDLALAAGGYILLRRHGSAWSAPARSHRGVLTVLANGSAMRLWWDDRGLEEQRIHVS